MKEQGVNFLDFEVDKLTRSIENVVTGDSFITEVSTLRLKDIPQISIKNKWLFDWKKELNSNDREVYKLTIQNNPNVIQGLVSLKIERDHVYMHLIESSPFNKGRSKMYFGVPGNLVAYACRLSFQKGFEGFVAFHSKTKLIEHYRKTLGAKHFGESLMIIDSESAKILIDKYFKS